ncbi:MAG: glucosaminidase domain-containing protein [Verrucomicrobia bacterium]|nr:glucosaminidase domain-containing protein [Verrucomicrobiota bacterium]
MLGRLLALLALPALMTGWAVGAEPLRLLGSGTPDRRPEDRDVRIWLSGRTLAEAAAPAPRRAEPSASPGSTPGEAAAPAEVGLPAGVENTEAELIEEITQSILPYPDLATEAALRLAPAREPASAEAPLGPTAAAPRVWREVIATGRDERERSLLALLVVFADRLERRERIPAAATIAMALHESGYGRSRLAAEHHNYFGLKLGRAAEPFVELPTRELGRMVRANFRAYRDFEAGIDGFAEFLRRYPRYRPAWAAPDARGFVASLLRAGYCPEPDYLDCIETILRRHRLDLL